MRMDTFEVHSGRGMQERFCVKQSDQTEEDHNSGKVYREQPNDDELSEFEEFIKSKGGCEKIGSREIAE